jgi:hypothetical protein
MMPAMIPYRYAPSNFLAIVLVILVIAFILNNYKLNNEVILRNINSFYFFINPQYLIKESGLRFKTRQEAYV